MALPGRSLHWFREQVNESVAEKYYDIIKNPCWIDLIKVRIFAIVTICKQTKSNPSLNRKFMINI